MIIKNRTVSIIYKLLSGAIGLIGILMLFGLFDGRFNLSTLSYYTMQSNVLCMFYFFACGTWLILHKNSENSTFWPRMKGALVLCILVTGLVYHFLLAGGDFKMAANTQSIANIIVHYLVPLLVFVDWLLFDNKGVYQKYDPFLWLVIPYAYMIYAFIAAQIGDGIGYGGSRYPYFFIDIDVYGIWQVALNVVLLSVGFLALGYVIKFIDHLMGKKRA